MAGRKQLLDDDVRARQEALDVSRSFIVQAPAGSGKTELLIQRYLKLLAVVDDPEEILAITFTRKASAEMQFRVLSALQEQERGNMPEEDHQRLTAELAAAALARSADRDWNLIGNPRRMRILTLDALNASVSRAQPLSAPESTSGARIVVDAELKAVHRAAATATFDWLADESEIRDAMRNILRHVDNNTGLFVSYVSQMLATRDQWLPFIGSGRVSDDEAAKLRSRFESSLSFVVNEHIERTATAFGSAAYTEINAVLDYAAANLLADGVTASPICELAGLTELPAAEITNLAAWRGLAELLLTRDGKFRKKVDKRQGFPATDKDKKGIIMSVLGDLSQHPEMSGLLHGIRTLPPVRYTDEQWKILLALFRLLPVAVTELQRLFSEREIADHIEVALNAGAALGGAENPGDVALLLDYRVSHLLVDEMQDTSSAQYRMLEALTRGWEPDDGRTLYCVGDPMQSIYRFRNAEVGQFLLSRKFGIGSIGLEPLLLRSNFRSGEKLVEWFNSVFPSILAKENDPMRGAVAYSKAVPGPQLKQQGYFQVHPVFGSNPADEAERGCEVVSDTLAKFPNDEMAVLVQSRTHLPTLLAKLRNAGIAYSAVEIDRLTDLPEVIDVLALTRAAVHIGDRIAWLSILRAPWMGLSWSDLHALVTNDGRSTVWELLNDNTRLQDLSPEGREIVTSKMALLNDLVRARRTTRLRDVVENCWTTLGGPGALSDEYAIENVYRYLDVLGQIERAGTLPDIAELESTLDLERVSNNEHARLKVMTMHRAKGLQFDHVLLYGLGRAPRTGDRRVLSWFDIPGQHGVKRKIISPVGPRAVTDLDPVQKFIDATESDKNKHEQARLLYVACTRARQSLHLMGNVNTSTDQDSYKNARRNSLLHLLWPAVEANFAEAFESRAAATTQGSNPVWIEPQRRRFSKPWKLPNVKALPGMRSIEEVAESDAEVEFYWVGTEARIAGTLVHRWLQLIADGQTDLFDDGHISPLNTTERWLREIGIDEQPGKPIAHRVESALRGILGDKKGRWILDGNGHSELALSGLDGGELVSVVLDRVKIDEDGTHWIIDYKTSTHEGGDLDGFLRAEAVRYRSQLTRYASIYKAWAGTEVRCALYFPLLQSFVEVSA